LLNDSYIIGMKVQIFWYYDEKNISALECGEEFKEVQDLPFEILQIETIK
jgi:hypothetical protein